MKQQKGTKFYANRHSCYLLQYHLVVVVKYRRKVINDDLKNDLVVMTENLINEQLSRILLVRVANPAQIRDYGRGMRHPMIQTDYHVPRQKAF